MCFCFSFLIAPAPLPTKVCHDHRHELHSPVAGLPPKPERYLELCHEIHATNHDAEVRRVNPAALRSSCALRVREVAGGAVAIGDAWWGMKPMRCKLEPADEMPAG